MSKPAVYFADINDPDETGSNDPVFCHVVLADEYNKLSAELSALKAGQGEAVARVGIVPGTDFKSLDFRVELQDLPVGTKLYTAQPASADAVLVQRELLKLLCGATQQSVVPDLATLRTLYVQRMKATDELRALLAQSESKEVKS